MSSEEALKHAEEQGYDLVKIAPNAVPPVCRIMDYGKFRFEQTKKEKEAKKNQHVIEIKEIRMSPHIDDNDFNTKVSAARKFLAQGNRVKVAVRFRGREMAHTEIGKEILEDFAKQCEDVATMDKGAKLEGRMMSIFLSAKPTAPAKKSGKPKQLMPKMKTHSGAKKRFNLTKTGKVKRAHAFKSHILTKKDAKRCRRLRSEAYADVTNEATIKKMIPYK